MCQCLGGISKGIHYRRLHEGTLLKASVIDPIIVVIPGQCAATTE